jgi:hypothetical protein
MSNELCEIQGLTKEEVMKQKKAKKKTAKKTAAKKPKTILRKKK